MPRRRSLGLRPRLRRLYRGARRVYRRTSPAVRRRVALAACAGLVALCVLNAATRAYGASVSLLSVRRLQERSLALGLLAVHALRCDDDGPTPEQALREAALRHGVSVRLVLAVARIESSLLHHRISSTGAMGLMQLMPKTAYELGVDDPFDIAQSADGGVRYLAQLLAVYRGNTRKALAAYNVGMGRVPVRGAVVLPSETRHYVGRVLSAL